MHLTGLDWSLVAGLFGVLLVAAIACNRFAKTVSGFLAAERCAGRYLIAVSYGMAQLGVISLVWFWQQYYDVAFTSIWWGFMEGPALILIALSGWVVYRFRETRAMTMAQFFEVRYSRRFRIFAGFVAFIAGIVNYGIFPAVAARFFIALCGFPPSFTLAGIECSTFVAIMFMLLSTALFFVYLGGQVAVIITDFLQGAFGQLVFLAVMIYLLMSFSWGEIEGALLAAPEGRSMVDPFDLGSESRFNAFYWVISVVVLFYGMLGWQGTSGYNAAAINAHEAKMANILNGWRFRVLLLITLVLPICIKVVMTNPAYAAEAAQITSIIEMQPVRGADPEVLAAELRTPAAASIMLPPGLLGLFAAALVGAFISTNDTYLHSWGSIFIQDVVLPIRGKPLSTRAHLWLLRGSITGVAIFAFIFSMLYTPTQYVSMFLALTGAIFVGGAGSAIIGGLYWRRGTTGGAWTAMILGMSLAVFGVVVKQIKPELLEGAGTVFEVLRYVRTEVTGQVLMFASICLSVTSYVVVSLVQSASAAPFDLERMLHRGTYARSDEGFETLPPETWLQRLGFDRNMSGWDKIVTALTIAWPLFFTVVFFVGLIAYFVLGESPLSDEQWVAGWRIWLWVALPTAAVVTVWFILGGLRDMVRMFRRLAVVRVDGADDGSVIDGENRDDFE